MVCAMKHAALLALYTAALCAAAPAGGEPLRQEDILQAELRPGWRDTEGRHFAALHLKLAPGWKTYWRAPGDAGVPPEFDWSGSSNLGSLRLHWPSPEVFDFQGMQTIGYAQDLVLPIEITPRDPALPVRLQAAMDLGLCNEICMPAELVLGGDLAMPGAPDALITAALVKAPLTAAAAGLTALSCAVEPIRDGLRVTARMTLPQGAGPETVVMEPADPVWVSDAVVQRQGGALQAQADLVPLPGQTLDLKPETLRLTVLSAGRAVEVTGCPLQ